MQSSFVVYIPSLERLSENLWAVLERKHRRSRIHIVDAIDAPIASNALNIALCLKHVHFVFGHHVHGMLMARVVGRCCGGDHNDTIPIRLVGVMSTVGLVIWIGRN